MDDICNDKTSLYDIRLEDGSLINAAICLGEWLAMQAEATEAQRSAIAKIIVFLRNLPNPPPPDLHGEFGFEFQPNAKSKCTNNSGFWTVSVCRGMLEIFSCGRDNSTEFSWLLCPGTRNTNELSNASDWINQVSDPFKLMPPDHKLVIEASTWNVRG